MQRNKIQLALGAALALSAISAHAQTYDVATDFSLAGNPNGVWTFGHSFGVSGSLILADTTDTTTYPGLSLWRRSDYFPFLSPFQGKNTSAVTNQEALPGQFIMHPGQSDAWIVTRFTAPATGSYDLSSAFFAGTGGETSVTIFKNGNTAAPLFSSAITSNNPTFNSAVLLNSGDTLSFAVGDGGDGFVADGTPVNIRLVLAGATAPEPGTLAFLALGGVLVSGRGRRQK
jgi:hypothetical protein